jgi:hypothetical protein
MYIYIGHDKEGGGQLQSSNVRRVHAVIISQGVIPPRFQFSLNMLLLLGSYLTVASAELLFTFAPPLFHPVPQKSHSEHATNPASAEFDVQGLSDMRPAHVAHIRVAALAGRLAP